MNNLYIDTRNNKEIVVRLEVNDEKFELKSEANIDKAQAALPMIENVLTQAKINVHDINEIKVEEGPGSFTGIKVGVAIANALSFAGMIRINGKEVGEIVEPEY